MSGDGKGSVGRGRPPVHSRFKPGRSGNPRGRPKHSRNIVKLLEEELLKSVLITENGKSKRMSKGELMVKQLVNKAAGPNGDPRTILAILKLSSEAALRSLPELAASVLGGDDDQDLLNSFFQQVEQTDEPE